ncbi:MAG: YaaR family protein [Leptospirales bacterium]|nr:YaaR family protein [Leptospirales bacterium]
MIEIPKTDTRQTREGIKTKVKSSSRGAKISTFSTELENRITHEFHGSIEELMTDLKDQEKRFLDAQSLYELEIYKSLVKKILKMIIDNGFKTRKLDLTYRENQKGRGPEKIVLDKIDENLIKLSQMITRSNEAFNLMKTIEEIRGLILDLTH